jgi:Zn-dependent membrane protease YugP
MPDYYLSYGLVLIGILITGLAALNVRTTFARYSKIPNSRGLTGMDVARMMLEQAGIYDVSIQPIQGNLTDHYSPREKVLRLSESVYSSTSVAAIGVAAHECGHALQHKEGYAPLRLRSISVPLANIGAWLSWPVIILGIALDWLGLAQVGIFLFAFVVAFQLITLPVEFNASRRALTVLETGGYLSSEELSGSRKVLTAAAMTYVAALLSTILQLLRLIMIVGGGRRRR